MTEAWIMDAARTPRGIGKPGKGRLTEVHPQRILSTVLKALAERNNINTAEIDDIIVGCNSQSGKQAACIGRMAALDAGLFDSRAEILARVLLRVIERI
jgi:acetyl-CoA C-acetyltransferase